MRISCYLPEHQLRWFTKLIRNFLIFGVFTLVLACQSSSAEENESNELLLFSTYLKQVTGVYIKLFEALDISMELGDLAYSVAYEGIEQSQAIEILKNKLSTAYQIIEEAENQLSCCIKKPHIRSKTLLIIIDSSEKYVGDLPKQISDMLSESVELFNYALSEDLDSFDRIQNRQLDRMILILSGENIMAQNQQLAAPKGSPGYWYLECIIVSNNALINIVKSMFGIFDNTYLEEDIVAAKFTSENYLVKLSKSIRNGEYATGKFFQKYIKIPANNKNEIRQKLTIVNLVDNLENAFLIEGEIRDLLQELSSLIFRKEIRNYIESPEIQKDLARIEELTTDVLSNLVELRIILASERLELIGELGGG